MTGSVNNSLTPDTDRLIASLVDCRALSDRQAAAALDEFQAEHSTTDAIGLAEFLVAKRLVTPFQAERALAGNTAALALGPYLLLEPISSGHYGTVYKAMRPSDQREYAVRVLPSGDWQTDGAKEVWSAVAASPLDPAVIPLTDVDTTDAGTYLAWPYLDGETLEHSVQRVGPLRVPEAVRVFAELADGLADCHDRGVVHGWVRPTSILLGIDRHAHMTDVGLGAVLAENPALGIASGSGISPVPRSEAASRDQTADAQSLGCALYFALTSTPPTFIPADDLLSPPVASPVRSRNPATPVALATLVDALVANGSTDLRRVANVLRAVITPSEVVRNEDRLLAEEPDTKTDAPPWAMTVPDGIPVPGGGKRPRPKDDHESIDFDLPGEKPVVTEDWNERGGGPVFERSEVILTPAPRPTPEPLPPPSSKIAPISLPANARPNLPPPLLLKSQGPDSVSDSKKQRSLPSPVDVRSNTNEAQPNLTRPVVVIPDPPLFARTSVRKARSLLFWKGLSDAVMVSVFGPPSVAPGQRIQLMVYANLPETFTGVATLCRALHAEADLLGVGYIDRPVPHKTKVGVHVAVANAGVAKSLTEFTWTGQTQPRTYELFVPWESPPGLTSGVVSAGIDDERVGTIPFHFVVLPRSS